MAERLICFELTGTKLDGQWHVVESPAPVRYGLPPGASQIVMVATGSVVWDSDRCAEVYVPEDKLALWRAEHDVEER